MREVGDGVAHVKPGDRVAWTFIMPCGSCRHCAKGLEDVCETFFNRNRLREQLYDGTTRLTRKGEDLAMYCMGDHATHGAV